MAAVPPPDPAHLADLAAAGAALFQLDDDRAVCGRDYQINLQGVVHGYDGAVRDAAPGPLFALSPDLLRRYAPFVALLDNFTAQVGVADTATPQQAAEESAFLDAALATRPMRYAHALLAAKGAAPRAAADFKALLHQTWFRRYTRETRDDTCGWEHVFSGEVDAGGKVIGLHNWVAFAVEEAAGRANYYGHIPPKKSATAAGDPLISIQFAWRGSAKDISSMFVGTSPACELALYSLLFLGGAEETRVVVGGLAATIKTYRIRSKYGDKVGSAFPILNGRATGPPPPTPYGGGRPAGGRPPRTQNGGGGGRPDSGRQPSCGDIIVEIIKLVVRLLK